MAIRVEVEFYLCIPSAPVPVMKFQFYNYLDTNMITHGVVGENLVL